MLVPVFAGISAVLGTSLASPIYSSKTGTNDPTTPSPMAAEDTVTSKDRTKDLFTHKDEETTIYKARRTYRDGSSDENQTTLPNFAQLSDDNFFDMLSMPPGLPDESEDVPHSTKAKLNFTPPKRVTLRETIFGSFRKAKAEQMARLRSRRLGSFRSDSDLTKEPLDASEGPLRNTLSTSPKSDGVSSGVHLSSKQSSRQERTQNVASVSEEHLWDLLSAPASSSGWDWATPTEETRDGFHIPESIIPGQQVDQEEDGTEQNVTDTSALKDDAMDSRSAQFEPTSDAAIQRPTNSTSDFETTKEDIPKPNGECEDDCLRPFVASSARYIFRRASDAIQKLLVCNNENQLCDWCRTWLFWLLKFYDKAYRTRGG